MRTAYMLLASKMAARKIPGKAPSAGDTEARFLAGYDVSKFERPSVAVDVVLLAVEGGRLLTLVVERTEHPAKGMFALPGGFVGIRESLDGAAARLLRGKAGLSGVFLEQL